MERLGSYRLTAMNRARNGKLENGSRFLAPSCSTCSTGADMLVAFGNGVGFDGTGLWRKRALHGSSRTVRTMRHAGVVDRRSWRASLFHLHSFYGLTGGLSPNGDGRREKRLAFGALKNSLPIYGIDLRNTVSRSD